MNRDRRNITIIKKIAGYCDEILDAQNRFGNTFENLKTDTHYKNSVAMCILQIGELAGHLSDDFRTEYPEMPWQDMKAMRNIAAHDYENFDLEFVWEAMTDDIPALRAYCLRIVEQQGPAAK
jgi:uncharacterized protein with HEPN domain